MSMPSGTLDGKPASARMEDHDGRYPEQPEGLLSLDPQLICYSWISGISDVAIVAFVRKRVPEIQYLTATISEEQRREFGQLVEATASQIEAAQFLPRTAASASRRTAASAAPIWGCAWEPATGRNQTDSSAWSERP